VTLLELYQTLRTLELVALREAFRRDAQDGADGEFCDSRIKMIDRVVRERERDYWTDDDCLGYCLCPVCGSGALPWSRAE
jgi:hypothetical protein